MLSGMGARIPVLVLSALLLVGAARRASALEVLSSSAGTDKEPGVYVLDAVLVFDVRPAALRHIISRLCEYRDHIDHLSYCRVFKVAGNRSWSYAAVAPPVINARDYTIVSVIEAELNPDGTGTYKSLWKIVTDEGPPPRSGVIRLGVNDGMWQLTGRDGGKRTEVRYQVRLAPGGVIPAWAAGYVAKRTMPDSMRVLERLAQEEDRRGTVLMPVPGQPWVATTPKALDDPLPPAVRRDSAPIFLPP